MSYSSSVGRFLERDPIRYSEDGMNLYQAYRSNPIIFVDPLGTQTSQPTSQTASQMLETSGGIFEVWMDKEAAPVGWGRASVRIEFKGNNDREKCPDCANAGFVQVFRTTDKKGAPASGVDPDRKNHELVQKYTTDGSEGKGVQAGWAVDINFEKLKQGQPYSPDYNECV